MLEGAGTKERWLPVEDFPGYEVSNLGMIRSLKRGIGGPTILRPNKGGSVTLRRDGKNVSMKVHRLVLLTFHGPAPEGKPLCRHLDDDTSNCRLSNLAWGDYKDNYEDGVRNGSHGPGTPGAKIRSNALRGKARPESVKRKISATKRQFRDRQFFGQHGPDGKFTGMK